MSRVARIIVPGCPHHITQRGNYKQNTFRERSDYLRYLKWLEYYADVYKLRILAYSLMPNHVHFAAIPEEKYSLAKTFNVCHMRYSQYFNEKDDKRGHLWQGRFYSCALDEAHLYLVVRYIENNPVRAGLVEKAEDWEWSSARAHLSKGNSILSLVGIEEFVDVDDWKGYLVEGDDRTTMAKIKSHTLTGRPLGNEKFICELEKLLGMQLRALPRGRQKRKK